MRLQVMDKVASICFARKNQKVQMTAAALPANENERIALLHALDILDSPAEPTFDRITRLVARTLRVPIALVSLVDTNRQWFKSRVGLDALETPREFAFCAHTLLQEGPMIVGDATQDDRFADNPLVIGDPNIRFYAGAPIVTCAGLVLGTLCAIDSQPHILMQDEIDTLIDLADLVSQEIQQRETALLARTHMALAKTAIEVSESHFRSIFERAALGIALVAPHGRWISVNQSLCDLVGYSQTELLGLTFQDITYPQDLETDLGLLQQLVEGQIDHYQLEKRYFHKTGKLVWISLSVTKQLAANGKLEYFIAFIKDIQARKEAEAALTALRRDLEQRVEERTHELRTANEMLSYSMAQQVSYQKALIKREAELSAVIENANDAYVCMDQAGVVSDWNQQAQDTFGWSAEEAIGRRLEELIIPPRLREAHRAGMKRYLSSGESRMLNQRLELSAIRRDGSTLPVEVRVRALDLHGQKVFSAFLHDITERKRHEEQREHEARHDALTGLPNRRALFDMLPQAIARSNRNNTQTALLFLDLDGFKAVNDMWGHEAGDSLLQEMARRLSDCVRKTDAVARLGGDEFTLVLEGLSGREAVVEVTEKLLASISIPVLIGSAIAQVSASIGIALYLPGSDRSPDQLVNAADAAMYEAKRAGKSRYRFGKQEPI